MSPWSGINGLLFTIAAVWLVIPCCLAACNDKWSVQLDDTNTVISNNFTVSVMSTSGGQNSVNINGNSGTVSQGGRTTNIVVNYMIPWDDTILYAFVGADSTGLMMGWAYCHGNELTDLWLEDTTGVAGFVSPAVTGTCSTLATAKDSTLDTTERCYTVDEPDNVPTISGSDLTLQSGSPGKAVFGGETFEVLPFTVIDCKTCQSSTLAGGWVEVHAVMKSPTNICLGIFYLQVIPKGTIPLNYLDCFFTEVSDKSFTAQYEINNGQQMTLVATTSTQAGAAVTSSTIISTQTTSIASPTGSNVATTTTVSGPSSSPTSATSSAGRMAGITVLRLLVLTWISIWSIS